MLAATTNQNASAILQYQKIEAGAGWTTIVATPTPWKKDHRAVVYIARGTEQAFYNYRWIVTAADGTTSRSAGTFETR